MTNKTETPIRERKPCDTQERDRGTRNSCEDYRNESRASFSEWKEYASGAEARYYRDWSRDSF
jgi:hypothetical protein